MISHKTIKINLRIVLLIITVLLAACSNVPVVDVETKTSQPPTEVQTNTPENEVSIENTATKEITLPTATTQPTNTDVPPTENQVSFSNDVFPIIEYRCLNCHGG
ncbi:MAG: hypothetical protein CVU41_03245 [Chloroflexi bacterium HGW-Chloroflexi-3]|nr:MAG: hypothetical protein CVU41_03245 [Chloroflexi bacterium HGW-Chloroflexi-3]